MQVALISTNPSLAERGLRIISACLKQRGHQVKLLFLTEPKKHSALYTEPVLEAIAAEVRPAQLIGVSSYESTARRGRQLVHYLQRLSVPLVWGGLYPTADPEGAFADASIICRGEGEEAMLELADAVATGGNYEHLANLWTRSDGRERRNDVRPLVEDLDTLPMPDNDCSSHRLLENGRFRTMTGHDLGSSYPTLTTRGCPHRCTYCCNLFLRELYQGKGGYVRKRSPAAVVEEIVAARSHFPDVSQVFLGDDTLFIRPREEIAELAALYQERVGLPFSCFVSPATFDRRKFDLLIDAGLGALKVGVQGGCDRTNRDLYDRAQFRTQVRALLDTVKETERPMRKPRLQFIGLSPLEPVEAKLETVRFVASLPPPFHLQVFPLIFFWGTRLAQQVVAEGLASSREDLNSDVDLWDISGALCRRLNRRAEVYPDLLLFLMAGTSNRWRCGQIPRFAVPILTSKPVRWLNRLMPVGSWYYRARQWSQNVARRSGSD